VRRRSALHAGACALAALLAAGCGRYADFTLPAPAGPPLAAQFSFVAHPEPVLPRGAPGEWDAHDVLNPSVVKHDGAYYNLYSGFDGATWHTGLAVSRDALEWQKQGKVLSPDARTWEGSYMAANGAALYENGEFWYWYQAGPRDVPRIGLARSPDARTWRKEPAAVLDTGPRGSWDERGVGDPYVIRRNGWFYMYYLGQDRARRQRLGLARSPDGVRWEKLRTSPVLELGAVGAFDENGLGEPAEWQAGGWYYILYTGRDRGENRRLGLARSRDGVHWEKQGPPYAGSAAWDSKVICDATVLIEDGRVRVWFGGGDRARPDENLNGQIGFGDMVSK
jgi:predicted GH43/DUF377 family glycosyl hydrolase